MKMRQQQSEDKTLPVVFKKSQYDWLKETCEKEDVSMGHIVRKAVDEKREREEQDPRDRL